MLCKQKIICFFLLGETADIIIKLLTTAAKNYEIENKIVSFSGDNAPVNFGNVNRTGNKNVFKQLKDQVNANMIGVGCTAHTLHNSMRNACDQLSIDVEYIAVKIFTHFYRFTVRLNKLKQFCDLVDETYVKLHGYIKTRFLALKECLDSIIGNFDALNEYFHSLKEAPVKILEFFNDPFALVTLIFVRDQAANFQNSILQLEGDHICAIDAVNTIDALKASIKTRMDTKYFSLAFRAASEKIDQSLSQKRKFVDDLMNFHRRTLEYLNDWTEWLEDVKVFTWVRLSASVSWDDVECSALWMIGRKYFDAVEMEKLINQFAMLDAYLKQSPATVVGEKSTDKKWVNIFRHFAEKGLPFNELFKVVEFALVIPACNTTPERVFAHINDIWTPEKGNLKMENLRARLMVKFNWKGTCSDFHAKIKGDYTLFRI